mgnify:FL=1
MNLKSILKVGDEVFVDVIGSDGVSIGGVLEFYGEEYVATLGRKYITTERYGKIYKYDIETGVEITDSNEKRKLYPNYNNFVASKYLGVLRKELSGGYPQRGVQSQEWYPILQELQRLSELSIW